jgi:hypothetical protein
MMHFQQTETYIIRESAHIITTISLIYECVCTHICCENSHNPGMFHIYNFGGALTKVG